jgi:WD40 repeat protein
MKGNRSTAWHSAPMAAPLAGGDDNGSVGLWDTATGRQRGRLDQGGTVSSVAFSLDARTLSAGDGSGDVGPWDIATGKLRAILTEGSSVGSVAFNSDGQALSTGEASGNVTLLRQDLSDLSYRSFSRRGPGEPERSQWLASAPGQSYQKTCSAYG